MGEGIHYVGTRYRELEDLLDKWGYEVVRPSGWDEIYYTSPLTGRVLVNGRRPDGDATQLTFKFEEFWREATSADEAVLVREGAALRGYHYHGQSPNGAMRWCLDPEGHPENPCHVHPFPALQSEPREECDPIEPEPSLGAFENAFYLDRDGPSEEE